MEIQEKRQSLEFEFEFDQNKSDANEEKHGIGFTEAESLWHDEDRLEVELEHKGEQRYLLVAHYCGSLWSAIFIKRANALRIISVRRATKSEVSLYDKYKNDLCR
jgi:uncharacterized DUF497 family protein